MSMLTTTSSGRISGQHSSRLKFAFITPLVVDRPSTGFRSHLIQMQTVLSRIATDGVAFWDLSRDRPVVWQEGDTWEYGASSRRSPAKSSGIRRAATNLTVLGLQLWPSYSVRSLRHSRERILAWLDDERPTHVVLVHPHATELIPDLIQRGLSVFVDSLNVESDLARQLMRLQQGQARLDALVRWRTFLRREQRLFPLAHEVWVPSEVDAERQRRVCRGRARVRSVPNALDIDRYDVRLGGDCHDIVLPAHFGYRPNVVGAAILRDQVLPGVQAKLPDARLLLVGRDPERMACALEREPDVVVTGEVPDTHPYLHAAGVVAVPILQGGGTRYKILEALALGRPVVTTPLGCEGLQVRDGEHVLVRDIDDFHEGIVEIMSNPELGRTLGWNGRRLVEAEYSWATVESAIRSAIEDGSNAAPQPLEAMPLGQMRGVGS